MKTVKILAVLLCGATALLCAGCATTGQGPADDELIAQMVERWKAALIAQDAAGTMACFSENFTHYEVKDKATMTDMLGQAFDMGMGEDMDIDLKDAKTVVESEKATVGPIHLSTIAGSLSGDLVLAKENGQWLITTIDASGY
ncbi:MAG: Nuclear transport factor 2 family protein [Candidatus Hydrogenedentes bacterium]|nr:Nuclear transport factor 2 family protein [Candidatus Hydrogenedentota bacterium]